MLSCWANVGKGQLIWNYSKSYLTNRSLWHIHLNPMINALKGLMGDHAAEIIPEFLPQATVVSEQNSEIRQENLRADLVYLVLYENERQILNMELQTNSDSKMPARMLRYHVGCILIMIYR